MANILAVLLISLAAGSRAIGVQSDDPDCPHPCYVNGHKFCYPPPCPPPNPNCTKPFTPVGQCCEICETDCPAGTCNIGNGKVCYPVPCPMPPCDNPVTTKGDCCPHCPDEHVTDKQERADCTPICEQGGKQYCFHPPCPLPPCSNPYTPKGKCCQECPAVPDIVTTATTQCKPICEQGGQQFCFHPPCPLPPCVDPFTPTGKCCQECPNGANCRINGKIYPANRDTIENGRICRCIGSGQFGSGSCTIDPNMIG